MPNLKSQKSPVTAQQRYARCLAALVRVLCSPKQVSHPVSSPHTPHHPHPHWPHALFRTRSPSESTPSSSHEDAWQASHICTHTLPPPRSMHGERSLLCPGLPVPPTPQAGTGSLTCSSIQGSPFSVSHPPPPHHVIHAKRHTCSRASCNKPNSNHLPACPQLPAHFPAPLHCRAC